MDRWMVSQETKPVNERVRKRTRITENGVGGLSLDMRYETHTACILLQRWIVESLWWWHVVGPATIGLRRRRRHRSSRSIGRAGGGGRGGAGSAGGSGRRERVPGYGGFHGEQRNDHGVCWLLLMKERRRCQWTAAMDRCFGRLIIAIDGSEAQPRCRGCSECHYSKYDHRKTT